MKGDNMKEYTFLEAVKILKEGKCEKIMPFGWFRDGDGYIIKEDVISATHPPSATGMGI